jgi:glycosyltransferase involved in cell wall biosynthesis
VAVSENTKQDVMKILGIPEEKINVVYHGCSFPTTGTEPVYSFPYILFVGGRWHYKNFLLFVKSIFPVLKNQKNLRVVCTGSSFNQEEISFLQENGVEDKFLHCMVKTDEELYSLYHHALGFVYPSEYEGFGIPILEAYQADCPVILNRASCFPEIAGDAALYFSSGEELTTQIERLLSMSAEDRNELLVKQKERLSRYSWEKSARQMAEIYQSLCK